MRNAFLAFACAVAAAVPLAGQAAAGETLERVRQSGEVRCGIVEAGPGLSSVDSGGRWAGFWIDMCKAVAAATVGDVEAVRYIPLDASVRLEALRRNVFDVLSVSTTWTLGREAGTGLSFTGTLLYDGQGFLAHTGPGAKDLRSPGPVKVCVNAATTTLQNLEDLARTRYPQLVPVIFRSPAVRNESFSRHDCDLLTSDRTQLAAARLAFGIGPEHFALLPEVVSKEPLGLVVRSDDQEWFNIVRWTHYAMVAAEEKGITSANLSSFLASSDPEIRRLLGLEGAFGEALGLDKEWTRRVIGMVGSYGEVYERNLGPGTPMDLERGMNALWSKGGLIYAPPIR